MTQHTPPQAISLFDLIGRHWMLQSGIRQVLFNEDGSALVAMLEDGRLAFISAADAESPDSRMRQEVDTGRMTLRPREKALPSAIHSPEPLACQAVNLCRFGASGFASVSLKGDTLWRATPRGQTLAIPSTQGAPITALAHLPGASEVVLARGALLETRDTDGQEKAGFELTHNVERIAPSHDGAKLACWGGGRITVVETRSGQTLSTVECAAPVLSLAWSPCAGWVVAGCQDKSILLFDVKAGAADRITQFPAAVSSVDFSPKDTGALLASGAFRVVGWSLPDLPFGEHEGTPIETGKPGLTAVDRVAVSAPRNICAATYDNGLVVACRAGQPDELMLHPGHGTAVTSMAWSADGKHMGWGDGNGNLSIATFPEAMFK